MHNHYFFYILIALLCMGGTHAMAQKQNCKSKMPSEHVACVVKDLSTKQKRQIDAISKEHLASLSSLKSQLYAVRDSIHIYMDQQADHSTIVLPLMERESDLKLKLNKELYRMKLQLDKVLSKEQYQTLLNHQHANGMHHSSKNKKQVVK